MDTFLSSFSNELKRTHVQDSKYILHQGKHKSGLGQPSVSPGEKTCFKRIWSPNRREAERECFITLLKSFLSLMCIFCIDSIACFLTRVCRSLKTVVSERINLKRTHVEVNCGLSQCYSRSTTSQCHKQSAIKCTQIIARGLQDAAGRMESSSSLQIESQQG